MWMKEKLESIKVSDKEAKEFYNENRDRFEEKEQVRARHILLKDEDSAKGIIDELKKENKDSLRDRFIELAKAKSEGPSKTNGGDLNYFTKDRMVPEFADAAFSMKIGEFSQKPVKTNFGFHVIYIEDKKSKKIKSFESQEESIKKQLQSEKFKKDVDEMVKGLKEKAKIVYADK